MSPTEAAAGTPAVKFGLTYKLFLLVLVSFGLLIALIVLQIGNEARNAANAAIARSLSQSETILNTRLDSRLRTIAEVAGNLARDGRLLPLIYGEEALSLQDQCGEFTKSLDFDILMFTNGEGKILARSDDPNAIGNFVDDSMLFQAALGGEVARGVMKRGGQLLQIVATPVFDNAAPDIVRGTVAVAYKLSEELAKEIKNLTGSEIAFYTTATEADDRLQEVHNTFEKNPALLQQHFQADATLWQRVRDTNASAEADLHLGDETFHVLLLPLRTSDQKVIGFAMALRSRTELLRPFTIIQQRAVIVSLVCLIMASVVAFAIARHIGRPIIGLVSVTQSIENGDFPEPVPTTRTDEVGVLYRAVYKMGQELKEKAELENYLASLSEDVEAVDPNSATMVTADMSTSKGESAAETTPVKDAFQPGKMVAGRYRVERVIGAGAMGIVYVATDMELNEPVALKTILNPGFTGQALEAFKQEIRLARKITHKNVLRTHDFGTFDGLHYISMEYVQGHDLNAVVKKRGPLDIAMGTMLAKQMCSAIAAAHEEGIIHRDLKPQNMMINRRGTLKIMDFGIAINIAQEAPPKDAGDKGAVFRKDAMVGTPNFMSPEQFSHVDVDVRTDIYSLGVILFYVFTGELPFQAKNLWELSQKVLKEPPPKLRSKCSKASEGLEKLIDKALAKKREDRFASVQEISQALSALRAA